MHKWVDPTDEGAMAAGIILGGAPWDQWHNGMMIDMQKCDLTFIFTQHKEDGIQ